MHETQPTAFDDAQTMTDGGHEFTDGEYVLSRLTEGDHFEVAGSGRRRSYRVTSTKTTDDGTPFVTAQRTDGYSPGSTTFKPSTRGAVVTHSRGMGTTYAVIVVSALSIDEHRPKHADPDIMTDGGQDELEQVDGVGWKIAERLHARGIHTIEELADAPMAELVRVNQWGYSKAADAKRSAQELVDTQDESDEDDEQGAAGGPPYRPDGGQVQDDDEQDDDIIVAGDGAEILTDGGTVQGERDERLHDIPRVAREAVSGDSVVVEFREHGSPGYTRHEGTVTLSRPGSVRYECDDTQYVVHERGHVERFEAEFPEIGDDARASVQYGLDEFMTDGGTDELDTLANRLDGDTAPDDHDTDHASPAVLDDHSPGRRPGAQADVPALDEFGGDRPVLDAADDCIAGRDACDGPGGDGPACWHCARFASDDAYIPADETEKTS